MKVSNLTACAWSL